MRATIEDGTPVLPPIPAATTRPSSASPDCSATAATAAALPSPVDRSATTSAYSTSTPITRWPSDSMRRLIAPPIPPADPVTATTPTHSPYRRPGARSAHDGSLTRRQVFTSERRRPGIPARNERTIDADGHVVAPGFVDIHTHYDAQVLWDPATTPSPLHGVTTVVGGNCGFTIAPVEPSETDYLTRMLARVEGMPLESLIAGVPYDWRTFGEYLDRHSAIRRVVMGDAAVGNEADDEQIAAMRRVLAESIAAGGLGFSSSQATTHNDGDGDPVPSRFATPEELVALCEVTGQHAGTTLEFIPAVGGFEEKHLRLMADMSRAANRPLNWNVLVPNAARADMVWEMLGASDYAAERGGRVLALTVPDVMRTHLTFKAGFVFDALPDWAKTMALPPDEKMKALADPAERARLRERAASPEAGIFRGLTRWENMTIVETFAPENKDLVGRTVGEIAAERNQDPFDALLDIVLLDELRTVLLPPLAGNDDESWKLRSEVWRDPRAVVGASDAGAHLDMLSTFTYSTAMLRACRERGLMP